MIKSDSQPQIHTQVIAARCSDSLGGCGATMVLAGSAIVADGIYAA